MGPRFAAAREAHQIAEGLFRRSGIEVRHLLPATEDIADSLRARSTAVIRRGHLVLLVQIGSSMHDPYICWLHETLEEVCPRTLAWLRPDRLTRNDSFAASTLLLCNELGIEMFDCRTGYYPHLNFGDDCA